MSDVNQLPLLLAKKDLMFSRIQSITDRTHNLSSEYERETFLCEIETVDKLRSDFETMLDKINTLESKLNPKYVINYQPLMAFDDLYCRIKRAARSLEVPPDVKHHQHNRDEDRPRLPPLPIPEYSGDLRSWSLFYTAYKSIVHDNPRLSDSEKLHYLMGKLTGKARSVFAGINPCSENYKVILDALISKYEDKRLLASSYLDQIFEMKPFHSSNINNLEQFLDKFATSVSALNNLKINNLSDFIFLYTALKKLDSETARAFELDKRGSDIPSFDTLVSFVRDHIKILQRTSSNNQEVTKKVVDRRMDAASKVMQHKSAYSYTTTANPQPKCSLCNIQHEHLYKCPGFRNLTPNDRFRFVKSNSYCINCLSKNHRVFNCNSNSRCHKCDSKHHTMLHFEHSNATSTANILSGSLVTATTSRAVDLSSHSSHTQPAVGGGGGGRPAPCTDRAPHSPPPTPVVSRASEDVALCTLSDNVNKNMPRVPTTVLLATARVLMIDRDGNEHYIRALLDSASQSNFVTGDRCNRLGLQCIQNTTFSIKGIGGTTKATQGSVHIKFFSRFNRNIKFDMESLVVDKITERLPTISVDISLFSNFKNLPLADDSYATPGNIDMLIGASIFPHLILSRKVKGQPTYVSPYAIETVLGFVIVGSAPARSNTDTSVSNMLDNCNYTTTAHCCVTEPTMESVLCRFWEMEEVNVAPILSPDDKECEAIYAGTTTREDDGRYTVALPFKGNAHSLGDSRRLAEKCFFCLERKMQASPELKQAYDDVITEYLDKSYISPAPVNDDSNAPSYIIPHHGVIRKDKLTSKLRVVLNASAKTSTSVSLNDLLYNGQNLQRNLFDIIVNFRLFSVALSADIRQMFLCIRIRESDRRFQRILYRFSPDEPLQVYQFNRVCFGLKSSPFLALRTIKQLATDEGESFPKAKEAVRTGLYMDDLVYCTDSEDEAIVIAAEIISLMKAGQFDLVKWTSNSQLVLNSIPSTHRLSSVVEFDVSDTHKILGLCWSPSSDLFSLKICTPAEKCTKRTILSCVARLWNVMGFVAPVILFAKLLVKELWLCNCDWDDAPPEVIVRQWSRFRDELPSLDQIKLPRHVDITKRSVVNIIGFADASEKAYGAVVYFHVENDGVSTVHLISAKSKVAPRKVVSLGRLELCSALLLANLINNIVTAVNNRYPINAIHAFSDSTVALCWIHASPHRWDTFVANRVSKIQSLLSPHNFYHVSGSDNPVDCLSRGLTPAQIIHHPLWFNGPQWAKSTFSEWPVTAFNPSAVMDPPEEKKLSFVTRTPPEESVFIALANRFSSWSKLLRCVVYICRFAKLLTPAHILDFTPLKYLPAAEIADSSLISRHALLDRLVQTFWKRWRAEYLHTLQSREKWNTPINQITVGTVVIVRLCPLPRH